MLVASVSLAVLIAVLGGAITLAAALGGIAGFHAYRSAAAGWREERDAAVAKATRLQVDVTRLELKVDLLQKEVDGLRAKDVSKLYDLMAEHHATTLASVERIQDRHQSLLEIAGKTVEMLAEIATAVERGKPT